ncbi:MAG: Holliday junction branch migration protein RuvA [Lachnospiraceae bacterium]|nr:Holliday junction branch migration protein RuvA [Lachnospiraceae bacterium]
MIGYLRGELAENRLGQIVIDVSGVGYEVTVSEKTRENLPDIGNPVKIFTYMSVREDGVSLFGFARKDEQDMFYKLISVSGVGPKGALAILSVFEVPDLKYAILSEDAAKIAKAPTIGKKTAERIIIDLKDKIDRSEILGVSPSDSASTSDSAKLAPAAEDAVDALIALGYDKNASKKAVMSVEGSEELDTSAILKQALQFLF